MNNWKEKFISDIELFIENKKFDEPCRLIISPGSSNPNPKENKKLEREINDIIKSYSLLSHNSLISFTFGLTSCKLLNPTKMEKLNEIIEKVKYLAENKIFDDTLFNFKHGDLDKFDEDEMNVISKYINDVVNDIPGIKELYEIKVDFKAGSLLGVDYSVLIHEINQYSEGGYIRAFRNYKKGLTNLFEKCIQNDIERLSDNVRYFGTTVEFSTSNLSLSKEEIEDIINFYKQKDSPAIKYFKENIKEYFNSLISSCHPSILADVYFKDNKVIVLVLFLNESYYKILLENI